MTRILKYQPVNDIVADMPLRAKVVAACYWERNPTVFALVTDADERETGPRKFIALLAGDTLPDGAEYITTVRDVWHVFEVRVRAAGEEAT